MGLSFLGWAEAALFGVGLTALVIVALAAWRRALAPRIAVAVGLLLIGAGLLGSWFLGLWPFAYTPFHDTRHVGFLFVVTLLTALTLPFRFVWARWLAFGLGMGGLLSAGLNAGHMLCQPYAFDAGYAPMTWLLLLGCGWCLALTAALGGRRMREAFLARHPSSSIWASRHRVVRVVRWTILANLVATPMLLVYAWAQPVVPQTVTSALLLAALLGLGTGLAMARKVAGALLLSVAGVGLFAQAIVTWQLASVAWRPVTLYYAVFWLPAAALSLLCAITLARPALRLLRK